MISLFHSSVLVPRDTLPPLESQQICTTRPECQLTNSLPTKPHSALNTQHSTLNSQHSALNTQHSTLNTQHSALSTQHSTLDTRHSTLSTQHSTLNTQHSTLNTQHSTLNTHPQTPNAGRVNEPADIAREAAPDGRVCRGCDRTPQVRHPVRQPRRLSGACSSGPLASSSSQHRRTPESVL